ncbi:MULTISPECIES: hypothetical protein [Rhizobium/Agrobacterium group]|uniref:Uncharacterized protein n=1 Tax=Rhizobium rhizogenes TaxID=359 RepID=A0A546XQL3_RHIRH|nr:MULTISPECIES: hypothetical protein [Rhizobium/Agrobacterium group]TRB03041.1 hypothetical protein EXN68_05195 [Rhizobium rhizogenes]
MITSIRRTSPPPFTSILIVMGDGTSWADDLSIPADTHLRRMRDDWLAAGNVPEAYVPPTPEIPPIPRLGFWLAAAEIGVTKAGVKAHIDAMPNGIEKQQAIVYFEDAQLYRRTDPLLNQMAELENISQAQLDDLWVWALANYA